MYVTDRRSGLMKIGFISTMEGFPWGGSEELWSQSAEYLVRCGHTVIASVKNWGPLESPAIIRIEKAGISFQRRTAPPPPTFGQIVAHRLRRRLRISHSDESQLASFVAERPDFVLISSGGGVPGPDICAELIALKIPFAVLIQCASEYWWPDDRVRREIVATLQQACTVCFVSEGNRQLVRRQLAYEHPYTVVVRNPYRASYHNQIPWPATNHPWRMAFVGRLEPAAKGCDLLLEVLAQKRWRERDINVSLFGDGMAAEGMRELVRRYQLKSVDFRGHVDNVTTIWRDHHVLVLPSRYEGLPIVIVEAMLCGRPCITTDVAGNAELLVNNETGFIAAAPTVKHLSETMERSWAVRQTWAAMGMRAASAARQQLPENPARLFAEHLLYLAARDRR